MSTNKKDTFSPVFEQWRARFAEEKGAISNTADEGMIYVDRTILPKYPDWVTGKEHPELESTGPASFDAGKLELWLHRDQKIGHVTGKIIHQYLKDHDMIKDCLGLRDLEEIQKKGSTFFRKHFKGKYVFGWKSVVRNRYGSRYFPCLYGYGGEVCLDWYWLDYGWHSGHPALLFAST